jgi:DNA-binding response OmpR family regulator
MSPKPVPDPAPEIQDQTENWRPEVLLVEDHAEMRAYLRKHLSPHYQVLEASRGDEGLQQAREVVPDVIVSDIMMPGLDGCSLCRALKSDPETDFIPVILLTAKSGLESRLEGLEGGADDYISKPFEPAELLLRIRNLLRARARLKDLYAEPPGQPSLNPTPLNTPSSDEAFATRLRQVLDRESQDPSFSLDALSTLLGMSRASLHRRVTEVFRLSPAEVIIRFRLERAAKMLARRAGSVGEVAYAVGFRNLSHFVRRFREHYGQTPAAYAATHKP